VGCLCGMTTTGSVPGCSSYTAAPGSMIMLGRCARQLPELDLVVFACDMYGTGVTGDRDRVMASIAELAGGSRQALATRAGRRQRARVASASQRQDRGGGVLLWRADGARAGQKRRGSGRRDQRSRHPRDSHTGSPRRGQGQGPRLSRSPGSARPNQAADRVHRGDERCRNRLPADRVRRRDARLYARCWPAGARRRLSPRLRQRSFLAIKAFLAETVDIGGAPGRYAAGVPGS
jgi:hypothetical protein